MCGSPSPYTKGRQCDHVEAGFRAQGLDLLLSLPLAVGCQRKVRLKWREISGVGMAGLRFWAYQYQHLPLNALRGRWRDAERSGFDVLWNCDTVVEPDRPRHTMFDGPATLTMMAADTSRIRVGTLVTSLYFRQPVPFAKASVTVDHLGGGRVELALGVGDPAAGARAGGVDWPTGERVARFSEFVELVGLLSPFGWALLITSTGRLIGSTGGPSRRPARQYQARILAVQRLTSSPHGRPALGPSSM